MTKTIDLAQRLRKCRDENSALWDRYQTAVDGLTDALIEVSRERDELRREMDRARRLVGSLRGQLVAVKAALDTMVQDAPTRAIELEDE